jgi:uncharacterized protein
MKKAVIIHGMPGREEYFDAAQVAPSQNHWIPWLQRQLILHDVLAQTPEMPRPFDPKYEEWAPILDGFRPDQETMLVGHSLGAGFLARWLSERDLKKDGRVGKVVLVAPWMDPSKELITGFFDFILDTMIAEKTAGLTVFISNDDDDEMHATLDMLQGTVLGLQVREFEGKGHFTKKDMGTNEFPELRDHLLA